VTEPLHLGVTPWKLRGTLDADSLCGQAECAEDWGYDSFFLPENHFNTDVPIPDPILLLAAIAARTRRIRLGTSSWLLPIRHPLLAAEQVAALDQLSSGRVILGLGRGYQPGMLEAFGVRQKDKRERFEEILEAMIAAWSNQPIGDPERSLALTPRPRQEPHPPLWVAAFGPLAIAQVGGLGLPYLASPVESFEELSRNFQLHENAVREAGHTQPETIAIMRTVFISEDRARCRELREQMAKLPRPPFRAQSGDAGADASMIGSAGEVQAQLAHYREQLGVNHLIAVRPRIAGIAESWNRESLERLRILTA
jgi:alkanesulfonate monooxygenase SsuD/methylene tetrahydromethanopterin reductase-like flavin-dependent oxidoreductase (luciferase family)